MDKSIQRGIIRYYKWGIYIGNNIVYSSSRTQTKSVKQRHRRREDEEEEEEEEESVGRESCWRKYDGTATPSHIYNELPSLCVPMRKSMRLTQEIRIASSSSSFHPYSTQANFHGLKF